ncbi:Transposase [Sulfidibacter corallicola]|uniref:Transposase n=1 Tax=Sulfidibacter corallicola TaxID=2818388 RepID=A0A8A4TKM4_SULCO|nr:transposase [Sulfidibacter corallicola]QTD50027.1 transposase [Sulfidibacter corallicola]
MSRRPRIKLDRPVTHYHVMTRTAQQAFYLSDNYVPGFKSQCRGIIESMADIFYVKILAWVLMDNHYHLCLEIRRPPLDPCDIQARYERLQEHLLTKRPWREAYTSRFYDRFTDLSKFMAEINARMARAFNKANGTSGHMWGGRFKSKVIENEQSLMRVMTYIEQNPVRAGLCECPSDYAWCSTGQYKRNIEARRPVSLPEVGFLRHIAKKDRAQSYVTWMDFQAVRILHPEKKVCLPRAMIASHCLRDETMTEWREDFNAKRPVDWRSQAYGSEEFHQHIRQVEEQRKLELARIRHKSHQRRHARLKKEISVCALCSAKGEERQVHTDISTIKN